MSVNAPWLALSVDWMDSPMFDDSSHGERLAWVCLLTHTKSQGRGGRVRMRETTFASTYRLGLDAVKGMMARAVEHGAVLIEGDEVTVVNWMRYQDPRKRSGGSKKADSYADGEHFSKTSATHHTSHITKHTSHVTGNISPEAIYSLYPRKVGKAAALKAIGKSLDEVAGRDGIDDPGEWLLDCVREYAKSPAGQPPPKGGDDFRPHPATWFNQARYDDDRAEWNRPNGVDAKVFAEQEKQRQREANRARIDRAAGVTDAA